MNAHYSTLLEKRIIFIFLCLGSILISFNVAAIAAALPVISAALRVPDVAASRIITYYLIPYGFGALLYAPLTQRFSYRVIVITTTIGYGLSCFLCAIAPSLLWLNVGQIGMGVTAASMIPVGLMLIGELYEKDIRGRLVGMFFGVSFFASLAGIVVGGVADWRWLFGVPACLSAMVSGGLFLFRSPLLSRRHDAAVDYFAVFTHKGIRDIFIFIFAVSFFYYGVHKWFGIYLSRLYGFDAVTISFFFVSMCIASFVGQLWGGYLSDKKSRMLSCYLGLWGLGVGAMALAGNYPLWVLLGIMCIFSMSWTVGHNGISTILTDYPQEHRAAIASLNSSVRFVSGGIGFYISSIFVELNFRLTFFVIGLLIILLTYMLKALVFERK